MLSKTAEIKNEFSKIIDDDVEYSIKELKDVLSNIYKTMNKKTSKKVTTMSDDSSDEDDKPKKRGRDAKSAKKDKNGNVVVKKAPSAYNLFVQEKIVSIREKQPDIPAKERMTLVAATWKEMSEDEKKIYKTKQMEHKEYLIDMQKIETYAYGM